MHELDGFVHADAVVAGNDQYHGEIGILEIVLGVDEIHPQSRFGGGIFVFGNLQALFGGFEHGSLPIKFF